jgi:hypothetical protein
MSLIPVLTIKDFRKILEIKDVEELKKMQSFKVEHEGKPVFTVIVPPVEGGMTINDYVNTEAEYLGVKTNSISRINPSMLIVKTEIDKEGTIDEPEITTTDNVSPPKKKAVKAR